MKKRYLILGIITICITVTIILLLSNNDTAKIEIAKTENNEISTNETIPVNEVGNANNEIIQTNISEEQNIDLESKAQNEPNAQDTAYNKAQEFTNEKSAKQKQAKQNTSETSKVKQPETIVSNTKEEKIKPPTPTETTTKQENKQTTTTTNNDSVKKEETVSKDTTPVDTIKRISAEELQAEKTKYLNDIKNIKPGLKYVEAKRGQVFWPYRTTEIEIAVGGVSFGTVYYFVDVFVEGNQEKFKYYIDWAGE